MQAQVTLIRHYGTKIPEHDLRGIKPLVGQLRLNDRWISETRTKHALELQRLDDYTGLDVIAVLFEPRLVSMRDALMHFVGYEVLPVEGGQKALAVQEWRCSIDKL